MLHLEKKKGMNIIQDTVCLKETQQLMNPDNGNCSPLWVVNKDLQIQQGE